MNVCNRPAQSVSQHALTNEELLPVQCRERKRAGQPAITRNLWASYLLPSHPAQLWKVGWPPVCDGGTGEELREGGKLMQRLDRRRADRTKGADGWRVRGKRHWWLLHPLSAYWAPQAECCTLSCSCSTLTPCVCSCQCVFTREM